MLYLVNTKHREYISYYVVLRAKKLYLKKYKNPFIFTNKALKKQAFRSKLVTIVWTEMRKRERIYAAAFHFSLDKI